MGLLRPDEVEIDVLRDMFNEASFMHGEECRLILYEKYVDDDGVGEGILSNPVTYDTEVFFEENPSIKTLKSFNWYVEDDEILPSIIHIPSKIDGELIKIREGSKLQLIIGDYKKDFRISSVRAPFKHIVSYTCKLTPWFDNKERNDEDTSFDNEKSDEKYSFFSVDKD